MSNIAVIRLSIFIAVTIAAGILVFFEPSLNIGAPHAVSMYEAIRQGMPLKPILTKLFIIIVAIFGAQLFLIGLTPKEKTKEKPKKKRKSHSA